MRLRLVAAILFIALWTSKSHCQDTALGPASIFRISPSTLPATCNNGDVRFDSVSSVVKFCSANVWANFGSAVPAPSNTTLGGVFSGTVSTNQFLIGINNSGNIVGAQPICSNLSNGAPSCSIDATNANNISAGTIAAARLPNPTTASLGGIQAYASVSNQWINAISALGVPSSTQPAFTNISGTASSAQIPVPTVGAIGGVMAYTKVSNQYIDAINTSGSPSSSQVNFTNLAGTATSVQLPVPTVAAIGGVMAFSQVSNQFINSINTNGSPSSSQPAFTNLSGTASIAQGGTGTGTTSQAFAFIGPTSSGGAPSFRALISSDLPATSPGNLSVANTTANYTALATDNMIIAGSATGTASFAVTLPTPVGITGKEYCILDNGVDLVQNITIATVAGTIGGIVTTGASTYLLNTNQERLCVFSDNVNYQIRVHDTIHIPTVYTPTILTWGTVTTPTTYWRRQGKYMEFHGSLIAGTPGSGTAWSMTLPTGVTIDTSYVFPTGNTTAQAGMYVGFLQASGGANAAYNMVIAPGTSKTLVYIANLGSGTTQLIPQTANTGIVAGQTVSYWFMLPNQAWQP